MIPTEAVRSRIAVFIDFDNVEIGVKSTIGGQFDIGLVLEAIKERGEIVTKIAYSDWKRVGDYSRQLTQHAIRMVQRNFTPGGDKNGADITMALDALEMAFTHDHINAFVIVGGDSDFISLVEKLKQYGRKVIVVGGRQFTSVTMQRNCHEFIAYENLVGSRGRSVERGGRVGGTSDMSKALPIVKRALKVLSEREVTPQLGLLKSTLLQLDSTFSEREYGASSFRDFMEKIAQSGAVTLKHSGRSMLVESRDENATDIEVVSAPTERPPQTEQRPSMPAQPHDGGDEEAMPPSPMSMQDGIRAVQQALMNAPAPPRWPMYVRQAKQFLRSAIDGFDERKYGFVSVVDLLRAAGKEGVLRVERDRQGAVRVFPGPNLGLKPAAAAPTPVDLDETVDVEVPAESIVVAVEAVSAADDPTIEDGVVIDEPRAEAETEASVHGESDVDDDAERQPLDLPEPEEQLRPGRRPKRATGARKTKTAVRSTATTTRVPRTKKRRTPPPEAPGD